ncbi:MAG: 5'-nucleotidase C-terminal domain-containing protein [Rhodopseudomonas palustris]|uniref:5'-nucleotidase C-terminal domain-containing protein n=1 Tax=Rhodopseudomonas palustris TaxID=1076 RepID=A0A933RXT8_RHOPL|nr:5'-nucleotidase C-terminal domain-containing protein [Rhodopseudomonas palustris]
MTCLKRRLALLAPALALTLAATALRADDAAMPVELRILAINDFHGYLQPPQGGILLPDPADPAKKISVPAGGAEHMATLVQQLRAGHVHSIFVAAGDLIGASPFLSAMFHDEPTIESMSLMGLALSAVGNHEFDEGKTELLRMQNGGCHPVDGCMGPHPFTGAKFNYLAASTVETATGKTVFPAHAIRHFGGIPVGFIGLTLKATPTMVSPPGVAGLQFLDEADAVNAQVAELKTQGVEAIVVLIHEGGFPSGGINDCPGISGPIVDIVRKFDRAVDVVISGHTHRAYSCTIDGRLVTSGDKYGTLVTAIDLVLDPKTRDIVRATADNVVVSTETLAKDPAQTALIASYDRLAGPIAARPAGSVTASLSRMPNAAGESALGDLVADAQLAATSDKETGGAEIAITNPGGLRADINGAADGQAPFKVTFGDVFAAQPFRNQLVTMTLTGAQLKAALELQWQDPARPRILQVSHGFSYVWDNTATPGARIVAERMLLHGRPIAADRFYRVTVNAYLAAGGDGFAPFTQGTDRLTGVYDVDALFGYFKAHSPIAPAAQDRIARVN